MFRTARLRHSMVGASLRHRIVGAVAALTLGVSVLSGCAAGQISQSVDQVPNQDGSEATVGAIGVRNALIATPSGDEQGSGGVAYIKGSTATVTFWLTNSSSTVPDKLTGITTDAGTVTLSGDATVEPQSLLQVGGSDSPVTATIESVAEPLKFGVSVPFTFSFAKAGDVTFNVAIQNPPERTGDRETTNIYHEEPTNLWGD